MLVSAMTGSPTIPMTMLCHWCREMQAQLASQATILKEQEDELRNLNQEHAVVGQIKPG